MGRLTHTVKGPIASFRSADVAPIESLKLHFLPKQEGSGDPSPTNVRPITGWTGCNLFGSGRNLLNLDRTVGDGGEYGGTTKRILDINKFYLGLAHSNYYLASYINDYNINNQNKTIMVNSSSSPYGVAFPLPCKGGQSYHIHCEVDDDDETRFRYNWYQADGTYISNETIKPLNRVCDYTKTVPENAAILCMIFTSPVNTNRTYHNIYVSIDSKNEYTPFNGLDVIPMTWSSHGVEYGGYIDPIAGEIVAEWIKYVCTGNEELTKWSLYGSSSNIAAKLPRSLCSGYYFDGAKNAMCNLENSVSNIQMYYGYTAHGICISNNGYITIQVDGITTLDAMSEWLAENKPEIIFKTDVPRRYTLTSQQIKTFLDYNNFWSDTNDDTEVEYAFRDHLSGKKPAMNEPHIATATSAPVASFSTDMKAPIVDLKAHFTPVQEGSGDPSPVNVRPIRGCTGCNIRRSGKNLLNTMETSFLMRSNTVSPGRIDTENVRTGNSNYTKFSQVFKKGTYTISGKYSGPGVRAIRLLCSCQIPDSYWNDYYGAYFVDYLQNNKLTFSPDEDFTIGIVFLIADGHGSEAGSIYDLQLEKGSIATEYEEYVGQNIPISFPAMKNIVALDYSPYATQQNPHATIIKQTADELEFTTHGNWTYEYVRLFYMIPAGTYTAKIYASTVDENDDYSPLLSLYVSDERVPFAGIRNGQTATFTLTEDTVVDMRFFGNLDDGSQRTVRFSNFQIERGSTATDYESRATVYGGYIDLVRHKVVATHGFFKRSYGPSNPSGVLGDYERHGWNTPMVFKSGRDLHDHGYGPGLGRTFCNIAPWDLSYYNDSLHYYIDSTFAYVMLPVGTDADTEIEFCAELATPIEYDITPQILKTLKGTNNIWADTNGDIEVSYWTH